MNNNLNNENIHIEEMQKQLVAECQKASRKYHESKLLFLEAWKKGTRYIGGEFFNQIKPLKEIHDKDELQPDFEYVKNNIWILSSGEQVLLAVMCSFFCSSFGGELMKEAGLNGMADISGSLDYEQNKIIAELLINYRGW